MERVSPKEGIPRGVLVPRSATGRSLKDPSTYFRSYPTLADYDSRCAIFSRGLNVALMRKLTIGLWASDPCNRCRNKEKTRLTFAALQGPLALVNARRKDDALLAGNARLSRKAPINRVCYA